MKTERLAETSNSILFGNIPDFVSVRTIKGRSAILFGNTKQVIQDYDTVFDNSIPFRKNDLLRITYFRIPVVPGLHFVPWHRSPVTGAAADEYNLNVVDCNVSVTVARPEVWGVPPEVLGGTPIRRRQT